MISKGIIKFYARYVDDTLLLVKPENIDTILKTFNEFHDNLEFTVDTFDNCIPHFLDLEIHRDGLSIYRKDTNTAQYVNYDSYTKWNHKIAWIKSLITRAKKLCSPNKFKSEMENIKRFASYNGFPKWIVNNTIKRCLNSLGNNKEEDDTYTKLYMFLPYIGKESEYIVKRCKRKLFRLFDKKTKVKFNVQFRTTKISCFTSNKDKIPYLSNSFVVYEYTCPGCSQNYIGKTETTLFNRSKQHGWEQKDSAVFEHFNECSGWEHITHMFQYGGEEIDKREFQINSVRENIKILRKCDNWSKLAFLESLAIKEHKTVLNTGIKSGKQLSLF